jgi:serine/threonine protein phosphatase PrpC
MLSTPLLTGRRTVRAAGASDVGRQRRVNEDRFFVDADRGVFVVVDGIGGHAAGDVAAETAIGVIRERLLRQTGPVADRIREAITIANNEIHRLASSRTEWRGMACVLTAAVVDGNRAVVGHVGDSRLYKLQGQVIEKVTPDHSPVGEREDANELSELEAMRHPRRNEVYRDVGSEPRALDDGQFVFLAEIELPPSAALLICSDGLTDLVPSETIRQVVCSHAGAPDEVVRALIDTANAAGGKDNITAVYVEGEAFAANVGSQAGVRSSRRRSRLPGWLLPSCAVLAGVALFALGAFWQQGLWRGSAAAGLLTPSVAGTIVVRSNESIMAAIDQALPGSSVIVEPGEYRERLRLKGNVRVVSRVSRGATLRLPSLAAESDAAVVASGLVDGELAGFRIVGDAATPLGVGVMTRDAAVRLVDLEVEGAAIAALDLGAGGGAVLVASEIHDNPGSALVIRAGATARVAHNAFARNALSERTAAILVVEPDARPEWWRNVFQGISPNAIVGPDAAGSALARDNWFIDAPGPSAPTAPGRSGRVP